jgi:hypothetical protein
MKTHPAEGWVRAHYATSPEVLNALRQQIDDLTRELNANRSAPPEEAEGLAKGQEAFTVRFTYQLWAGGQLHQYNEQLSMSWDEIFATIGPAMFDEASEEDIRRQLTAKFLAGKNLPNRGDLRPAVNEEDFQTIKVQLRALGLIQKSTRKRAVRDTQSYWSLTPYGENYAIRLKAIRSGS